MSDDMNEFDSLPVIIDNYREQIQIAKRAAMSADEWLAALTAEGTSPDIVEELRLLWLTNE